MQWRVSQQTLHEWLKRYEQGGLNALADRSRRPASCPHEMGGVVEAVVLELRRAHPYWGPRRIRSELVRRVDTLGLAEVVLASESGVYRSLLRDRLVEADRGVGGGRRGSGGNGGRRWSCGGSTWWAESPNSQGRFRVSPRGPVSSGQRLGEPSCLASDTGVGWPPAPPRRLAHPDRVMPYDHLRRDTVTSP